ncbi:MAG TPA: peptidylprolyl isomerase [Polyangiaceae bacterium]|nr:peptidylprolyl isomerase [Polyangiaceae bacterium]
MRAGSGFFVCGLVIVGCSPGRESPASLPPGSSLSGDTVASVGSTSIPAGIVESVARAQRVEPRVALEKEIVDALFASGAERARYDEAPAVRAAVRGRLARLELARLRTEAAEAATTDEEVATATQRHMVELDRPEAFRVIHAVVVVDAKADAARRARAKELADRIAERVAVASGADEFRSQADSVEGRGDLEVKLETLKPVAADGRVVDLEHPLPTPETYVVPFARAASRLSRIGQKSPVVATEFGYHVLMLLERTEPHVVALEERRRLLHDEIVTDRARRLKKELLDRLRAEAQPEISRSVDSLLATIRWVEHGAP